MIDKSTRKQLAERKERVRRRINTKVDPENYEFIPAKKPIDYYDNDIRQRVAVYARVSTDNVQQTSSYELQKKYYEDFVVHHPNWTLVKIYADEGISGTSLAHRDEFNSMIADCRSGKIDMIIGSCTAQGGARGQKLTQPFFIQAALIVLESDRGVFQRPKVYPWRRRKRFIVRKKFAPFFQAEPQRTHTGFIVDPQQEVALGELTGLAVLFASVDGLLALHQQTPPAIRTGVGKQAKELLVQRHILPPAVESQIRVQREGTLGG